jgi:flagellar biosynthetic protein FlhB
MGKYDDKTEDPTPKRKREARREGQIAKSQEIGTWGTLLLASMVVPAGMGVASDSLRDLFARTADAIAEPDPATAIALLGAGGKALLLSVLPLAAAMLGFGIVVNLAQTGGAVSPKRLKPSVKRLNPLEGIRRLFSAESAWNTVKVLVRTVLLAVAAWLPMRHTIDRLRAVDQPPLAALFGSIGDDALNMVRMVSFAGLLLGLADYAYNRRRTTKQLRMSKQEIRDEHKNTEGDPQVKGQIRMRQREISRNRMLAAVADASVVVVNPTHVAVALRYDAGDGAPRLVAKGKGEIARRIREQAERHGVPMVRDVPLARALHDTCPLDHPIPAELYGAVAKVLAFVMTVGRKAAAFGTVLTPTPQPS